VNVKQTHPLRSLHPTDHQPVTELTNLSTQPTEHEPAHLSFFILARACLATSSGRIIVEAAFLGVILAQISLYF